MHISKVQTANHFIILAGTLLDYEDLKVLLYPLSSTYTNADININYFLIVIIDGGLTERRKC